MAESLPGPERIQALLDEISAERARGLMIQRLFIGITAALVAIFAIYVWVSVKTFDSDRFMVALEEEAVATVWPASMRELDTLGKDALPAISEAMSAELGEILPRLAQRALDESETFKANMNRMMLASLNKHFLMELTANKDLLRSKVPEFSRDGNAYDDLMRRLEASSRGWAQDVLDSTFEEHLTILQSISDSVQKLLADAQTDVEAGTTQSPEDVLSLFVEIFNGRLNGED